MLDTDHDGWIDEDDLPYDQLLLLERARAAEAADELPAPEAPAQAPAAPSQRRRRCRSHRRTARRAAVTSTCVPEPGGRAC